MNKAHTYLFLKFNMINFISVFHKAVIEIKKKWQVHQDYGWRPLFIPKENSYKL